MTNNTQHMHDEQLSGDDTGDRAGVGGLAGASVSGTEDALLEGGGVAAGDSRAEDRTPAGTGSTHQSPSMENDDGLTEEPAADSATGDDISSGDATGSGLMGNPG
jgi:hypothetical protein